MKNATMRISGKKILTFSVEYHLQLRELTVAYLIGISFQHINLETESETIKTNPTKTEIMKAVKRAVRDYGDDYHYREDEFPEDWEKIPKIIELTSHITNILSF